MMTCREALEAAIASLSLTPNIEKAVEAKQVVQMILDQRGMMDGEGSPGDADQVDTLPELMDIFIFG